MIELIYWYISLIYQFYQYKYLYLSAIYNLTISVIVRYQFYWLCQLITQSIDRTDSCIDIVVYVVYSCTDRKDSCIDIVVYVVYSCTDRTDSCMI